MNWSELQIDTTINIESLVASVAVLGAAIGYLTNLLRNWRTKLKDDRYAGTNAFILDMLESKFFTGMTEAELWTEYNKPETLGKRIVFGAWLPKRIGRFGFEKQLRHLQTRFLIRLTGNDHYHIEFADQARWSSERKRREIEATHEELFLKLGTDKYTDFLISQLADEELSSYQRRELVAAVIGINRQLGVEILISDLQSGKKEKIEAAVHVINRLSEGHL